MGLADLLYKPKNTLLPMKVVVYGIQGLGKTTFAATFPSPVLIQVEEGAAAVDVMALPRVNSYGELMGHLNMLGEEDHDFKTVILDTLDWLEPLVWAQTVAAFGSDKVQSIEDFGYGKGYIEADRWWREILGILDNLRYYKGMNIVILAHNEIKRFESPETEAYDTYQMAVHKRSASLVSEWADMVLFMNYRVTIQHEAKNFSKDKRARSSGSGERVIHTAERPAFHAKSRWPLPDEIYIGKDATYSAFHEALTAATDGKYRR